MRIRLHIIGVVSALLCGAQGVIHFAPAQAGAVRGSGAPQTVEFIHSEFVGGRVVKGAPYSAEAVTETIQVLADGNRISRKSSVSVARDSEGRTRRDITPSSFGPLQTASAPKLTIIHDPAANASYTLDHNAKTARKMQGHGMMLHAEGAVAASGAVAADRIERRVETRIEGADPQKVDVRIVRSGADVLTEDYVGPVIRGMPFPSAGAGQTESLGKQNIEGIIAEGTRTTHVIPAGEIGNDLPIEIVNERWYSTELQTVVMSRHKDPRMGETTYRLANLRRDEPHKSLFEVPADYALREMPEPKIQIMRTAPKE